MEFVSVISLWFMPVLIAFILLYGTFKKIPTYEQFVEGGKEGIKIAFDHYPFSSWDARGHYGIPCFRSPGLFYEFHPSMA